MGTVRYASINNHRGCTLSRRDDLEALGYILIYFLKGSLPWQGVAAATRKERHKKIGQVKMSSEASRVLKSQPVPFVRFLNAVKDLRFDEKPDYERYRQEFRNTFVAMHYENDYCFDWIEKATSIARKHEDVK
ncbi:hypothetical protein ACOME3_007189 [Neoechinorhynchus agilis]